MSFSNRNLRCANCKSWWPVGEGAERDPTPEHSIVGQCRRYAPPAQAGELRDQGRHYPVWAITKRDDWCGEHQHVEM